MTKQEILNLPHLKISEEIEGKFVHIHAEEGFIITNWNESKDIKDYQGSECIYFPIRDEYDDHRIISNSEHDLLLEKQKMAIEELKILNREKYESKEY